MTRILSARVSLGLATGLALADDRVMGDDPTRDGIECVLSADDSTHSNPGKLARRIRGNEEIGAYEAGGSLVGWLASFPGYDGSVGDGHDRHCTTVSEPAAE